MRREAPSRRAGLQARHGSRDAHRSRQDRPIPPPVRLNARHSATVRGRTCSATRPQTPGRESARRHRRGLRTQQGPLIVPGGSETGIPTSGKLLRTGVEPVIVAQESSNHEDGNLHQHAPSRRSVAQAHGPCRPDSSGMRVRQRTDSACRYRRNSDRVPSEGAGVSAVIPGRSRCRATESVCGARALRCPPVPACVRSCWY